jgi:NTE family protein
MGDSMKDRLEGRRLGVVLSAGYFGFFGHAGFVQALEDARLPVACWGGASAGALVGALAAAGRPAQVILERLVALRRSDFWDPDLWSILRTYARGPEATGLLRGKKLRSLLEQELPPRFEDLPTPLLVVAANLNRNQSQPFAQGPLASRVQASCAYPGLFRAVELDGEHYWDGGLFDKAPVEALHRAFKPDAILVHYLPSEPVRAIAGWAAFPKALLAALSALRHQHFVQQVERVRALGTEVVVMETELPRLGLTRLRLGREVAREALQKTAQKLASPLDPKFCSEIQQYPAQG